MTTTAWAVTTGEAGMRTQARGLAQAVADAVIEKTVHGGIAWPWDRGGAADLLAPPWPDILVTCGRRSVSHSIRARKASAGKIFTVHIQNPRIRPSAFDLVIAMEHDSIAAGGNVVKVATALHDLTTANLEEAARAWAPRLRSLGRPLTGVAIGGDVRGRAFTLDGGRRLLAGLRRLKDGTDGALAITPSRRTPAAVIDLLAESFAGDSRVFLWDLAGDNPYRAILALSDRLVVTSDSVSMVSETLSTSHPVEVFDLGFARHAGFIQGLVDRRLVRRFDGDPTLPVTGGPINATLEAAAAVHALVQLRTGVSG